MLQSSTPLVATLLRLGVVGKDDWDQGLQEILATCCELLDVDRASFWSFREDPPAIVCDLGFVRAKRSLERGASFEEQGAPEYFAEIRTVQVLAVADTGADPRVRSLADYFETHRVRALLDVPVFAQGRLSGILCHEGVDHPRAWTSRDSELALTLSHTISTMLETRARQNAETCERRAVFLSQAASALAQTLDLAPAQELAVRRAVPVLGDIATLLTYDGRRARRVAQVHVDPGQQPLLDELCGRFGADVDDAGIGAQALRQRQSLLIPVCDREPLRRFGLADAHVDLLMKLRVRSAMSVPLHVRGEVTGALTFFALARTYDREDLRSAEEYALQVATLLENTGLYAEAQAAIRARDEFLGLAGHELRTPLAALDLAVERLRQRLQPAPPELRRSLDTLTRQVRRLSHLSDLIALASARGADDLLLRTEPVDLAAVVRDVALDFADLLAHADCELRLEADGPVVVRGDPTGLEVVLSNLLSNATKFGKGAPIEVSVRREAESAILVVRDHGVGIPPDRIGRVFDRFERAVPCDNFGGLGLGLHISARIVAAHGGQIRADSRDGDGATFTVELPA